MFLLSDTVDTAQTILQATNGTTLATAITRFTDPAGLARGPTQSATGAGAYSTAPTAATGVGSNAANPAGFGAVNGYIAGLADTISALTHLGARDLDPVLGSFTAPDPRPPHRQRCRIHPLRVLSKRPHQPVRPVRSGLVEGCRQLVPRQRRNHRQRRNSDSRLSGGLDGRNRLRRQRCLRNRRRDNSRSNRRCRRVCGRKRR
jgi:hypothetical protein